MFRFRVAFLVCAGAALLRAQSIEPSSGVVGAQVFASRFTRGNTTTAAYVSFRSSPANAGSSCTIEYNRVSNVFRLLSDSGLGWISPVNGVLSNSQCLVTNPSAMLGSDNLLVVMLPVTFKPIFYGSRQAYLGVDGINWHQRGSYTVDGSVAGVGVTTMLPETSGGTSGTFTAIFTHGGGASQHYLGYMLFLRRPNIVWYTAKSSCLVEYNRISNGIRLINDSGDGWLGGQSGIVVGTPGAILSNATCSVDVTNAISAVNGTIMKVSVPVGFSSPTQMATFLQAFDVTGAYTGMTQVGQWTGSMAALWPGPSVHIASPNPAPGSSFVVDVTAFHTGGRSQFSSVHLRFGTSITAPGVCHLIYFPDENSLNLIADSEVALVGPSAPVGENRVISNGRCSVNVAGASIQTGVNHVDLKVPVTLNPATFDGDRTLYLNAFDKAGNLSHWVTAWTYRVQ